jgi:hypothetical protein
MLFFLQIFRYCLRFISKAYFRQTNMHVVDYWIFRYFCITQVTLIFLLRYMRCMASGKITFAKTQFIAGLGQNTKHNFCVTCPFQLLWYTMKVYYCIQTCTSSWTCEWISCQTWTRVTAVCVSTCLITEIVLCTLTLIYV